MNRLVVGFLISGVVGVALGGVSMSASAQEPPIVEVPPPPAQSIDLRTYEEYRRDELRVSARRSRNALIGLSAATAVGTALVFPGLARQCITVTRPDGVEELRCTTAGNLLVGFGMPLFIGGLTGVLISGIMFGVRQGKIRRLNDRIEYRKRAVQWDPRTSRFVF